jgi:hypothetical protein
MIRSAQEFSIANHLDYVVSEAAFDRLRYNLVKSPFDMISTLGMRMTGKKVMDAVVSAYGPKGSGKSEGDLYIADRLSHWLSNNAGGEHKPEYFFTIENVRSVDPDGTLKMFTSKQLIDRPNQVLLVDDASISSNARDFYKEGNKRLNAIITVARIYRHCILLNTISSNLIDSVLNQFSDYVIEFPKGGADDQTETNEVKFFVVEQKPGRIRKNRDPYHKYMQFYDSDGQLCQITGMVLGRASPFLRTAYQAIRQEKTDGLVMEIFDEKSTAKEEQKQITKQEKVRNNILNEHGPAIKKAVEENPKVSLKALTRLTGLTEFRINQVIASLQLKNACDIIDGKDEEGSDGS